MLLRILAVLCLLTFSAAHADDTQVRSFAGLRLYGAQSFDPDIGDLTDIDGYYMYVSDSQLVMLPGHENFANPGISATNITLGAISFGCDAAHTGTMARGNSGLISCNGSSFDSMVSGTTAGLMQSHLAVLDTSMSAVISAFPTKVDLTAYNAAIATINSNTLLTSTTITSLSGLEASDVTSLTAAINAKANGKAVSGTSVLTGAFPIFKSATVGSGIAVFHFTNDGTSTGTALFPNGPITASVQPVVSDATASYQMSWAWSNSNKTLTVTANKLTTSNILTGILGQAAANASVVYVTAWGN